MTELGIVSLFTGAGGLDYGFESAGFQTRVALESDIDCCRTLAKNRDWPIIQKDIRQVSSKELLEVSGMTRGNVALLLGGPPCQPFSKSAYWKSGETRGFNDPRSNTLLEYLRFVDELLPTVFMIENVPGLTYSKNVNILAHLQRLIGEINCRHGTSYCPTWKILNAADFGVPQMRPRFFLVSHRDGKEFRFPDRMYRPANETTSASVQLPEHLTAWDAIGNLCPDEDKETLRAKGRWAGLLPSIPEGENYLWHTNRKDGLPIFGWRTRYWSFLLKLAKNRPSWTLQAQPSQETGPFHWGNRRLSAVEMARLQTFPTNVTILGNQSSIQRQIGNAVPSLLAEVLAREIASQLLNRNVLGPINLSIDPQRPIPSPEPVELVTERYRSLIGDHPDHPGPGKGPISLR